MTEGRSNGITLRVLGMLSGVVAWALPESQQQILNLGFVRRDG